MWYYVYAGVFFTSLLFTFLLVPVSKKLAFSINVLDFPSQKKVHLKPMPLLGGLGMYFSILFTILLGLVLKRFFFIHLSSYYNGIMSVLPKIFDIVIVSGIVVFFGLLDDVYHFRSYQKLFFQLICGVITFFMGFSVNFIPVPGIVFLLTVFWVVLCMNSFNLLDHMDGLSSGVALIAGVIFFIFAVMRGQLFIATLSACFIGSMAGFLYYNFPPANIFMGESGSSFIGYFLGIIAIMGTYYHYQPSKSFLPVFSPLIILSVPFFDTIGVVIIRLKNKKSIFQGDKNHISHRLMRLGMTKKQAILFCYLLTFCCGIPVLFLGSLNIFEGSLVIFQIILILICVIILESTGRKNV
ncbi:MAG: undecaprenyl/decaprenyl-phosphate alpha-N-acetylglucosaminyl 1-phosphate transferase [Candidatus Omnitrophica bacterium]|nr:undecaprenyl/decaprenyl-phosphate alpha-N-acetylglucosaminyl 1-phosphate transferase [Candidatus Omnitrophota bacterium]